MPNSNYFTLLVLLTFFSLLCVPLSFGERLDTGPGAHVFQKGDKVSFSLPGEFSTSIRAARLLDEHGVERGTYPVTSASADFGLLDFGWYRVEYLGEGGTYLGFTTCAVLQPIVCPAGVDSPIGVDVALSWLGAKDESDWPLMAELARQTGAGWVRDRIHWREIQQESGAFLPHTKYDDSADIQSAAGLQILQAFHTRPKWANVKPDGGTHSQIDLLKLHSFCKGMAERFHGRVQAWEPWNEGNAENFGGFTVDELCTLQKAAWLGFKAGDPNVTVCWNPLGGINRATQAEDILKNETWPYFDAYSIHSYDWPHGFENLWEQARNAASGRPVWVTESDRGMTADPNSLMGDFTPLMDCRKAEFVAQSYVRSLFSGASRQFHFILGHYMEGESRTQFGLLREDHTPRPSYVALATVGRFLAGAYCIGRHEIEGQPDVHLYAFRARPDGVERDVIVAWTEHEVDWPQRGEARAAWPIMETLQIDAAYDYLGRPMDPSAPLELSPSAAFLLLPSGGVEKLSWRKVPAVARREGEASPVVLQFDVPGVNPVRRTTDWTQEAAYEFSPGSVLNARLGVYNLGSSPLNGDVHLENLPDGWHADTSKWELTLEPMSRQELRIRIDVASQVPVADSWLGFRGAFGAGGRPGLTIRNRQPHE